MPAKLLVAALAAALAIGSPTAHADSPTYDCVYTSVQVDAISQTREGIAVGYVVHAGDVATIRCYTTVDGTEVSSTPAGTGVTAGPVSFTASDTSRVEQCAEVTTTHGTTTSCDSGAIEVLDELWYLIGDLIRTLLVDVVDPAACAVLPWLEGDYAGVVTVNHQGDVYVDGAPFWDCPPYDIWPPAG